MFGCIPPMGSTGGGAQFPPGSLWASVEDTHSHKEEERAMLRRMTLTFALVTLGTLSAGILRAADQTSQDRYTEKQGSATEMMKRTTNTAAEKVKAATQSASRKSAIRGLPSRPS